VLFLNFFQDINCPSPDGFVTFWESAGTRTPQEFGGYSHRRHKISKLILLLLDEFFVSNT